MFDVTPTDVVKPWKDRLRELPLRVEKTSNWNDLARAVSQLYSTNPLLKVSGNVTSTDGKIDQAKTVLLSTVTVIDEVLEHLVRRRVTATLPTIDLNVDPRLNLPTLIRAQHHMQIQLGVVMSLAALPSVGHLLKTLRERNSFDLRELLTMQLPDNAVADVVSLIRAWLKAEGDGWHSCIIPVNEPTDPDLFAYVQRFMVAREFGRLRYLNNPGYGIKLHELTQNYIMKWLDTGDTESGRAISGLSQQVFRNYRDALRSRELLECWIEEITVDAIGFATCMEIAHAMEYPRLRLLLYHAIAFVFSFQLVFEAFENARGYDMEGRTFPWARARMALFTYIQSPAFNMEHLKFVETEWGGGIGVTWLVTRLGVAAAAEVGLVS